jgi:hypothetical protein
VADGIDVAADVPDGEYNDDSAVPSRQSRLKRTR